MRAMECGDASPLSFAGKRVPATAAPPPVESGDTWPHSIAPRPVSLQKWARCHWQRSGSGKMGAAQSNDPVPLVLSSHVVGPGPSTPCRTSTFSTAALRSG